MKQELHINIITETNWHHKEGFTWSGWVVINGASFTPQRKEKALPEVVDSLLLVVVCTVVVAVVVVVVGDAVVLVIESVTVVLLDAISTNSQKMKRK